MPNYNQNQCMPHGHVGYIVAECVDDNSGGGQVEHFDNNVIVDRNHKYTSGHTEHGSWQRNVERSTAIRTGEVRHPQGTTRYVERVQVRRDQKIEYTPSPSSSNHLESWNDNNAVQRSYKKGGGGGGKRSSGSGYYQNGGGSRRNGGGGYNQSYW